MKTSEQSSQPALATEQETNLARRLADLAREHAALRTRHQQVLKENEQLKAVIKHKRSSTSSHLSSTFDLQVQPMMEVTTDAERDEEKRKKRRKKSHQHKKRLKRKRSQKHRSLLDDSPAADYRSIELSKTEAENEDTAAFDQSKEEKASSLMVSRSVNLSPLAIGVGSINQGDFPSDHESDDSSSDFSDEINDHASLSSWQEMFFTKILPWGCAIGMAVGRGLLNAKHVGEWVEEDVAWIWDITIASAFFITLSVRGWFGYLESKHFIQEVKAKGFWKSLFRENRLFSDRLLIGGTTLLAALTEAMILYEGSEIFIDEKIHYPPLKYLAGVSAALGATQFILVEGHSLSQRFHERLFEEDYHLISHYRRTSDRILASLSAATTNLMTFGALTGLTSVAFPEYYALFHHKISEHHLLAHWSNKRMSELAAGTFGLLFIGYQFSLYGQAFKAMLLKGYQETFDCLRGERSLRESLRTFLRDSWANLRPFEMTVGLAVLSSSFLDMLTVYGGLKEFAELVGMEEDHGLFWSMATCYGLMTATLIGQHFKAALREEHEHPDHLSETNLPAPDQPYTLARGLTDLYGVIFFSLPLLSILFSQERLTKTSFAIAQAVSTVVALCGYWGEVMGSGDLLFPEDYHQRGHDVCSPFQLCGTGYEVNFYQPTEEELIDHPQSIYLFQEEGRIYLQHGRLDHGKPQPLPYRYFREDQQGRLSLLEDDPINEEAIDQVRLKQDMYQENNRCVTLCYQSVAYSLTAGLAGAAIFALFRLFSPGDSCRTEPLSISDVLASLFGGIFNVLLLKARSRPTPFLHDLLINPIRGKKVEGVLEDCFIFQMWQVGGAATTMIKIERRVV